MVNRVRAWIRSMLLRRRVEQEMQEEMGGHLERATARLIARGLGPVEARREATREFGNVTFLKEEGRSARGGRWVEALAADSRFALRHFRRNPGASLTMLIVLAAGMSISTALFAFLHGYTVQTPPGVPYRENLVRVRGTQLADEGLMVRRFSYGELQEYQRLTGHFSAVAGWANHGVAIDIDGTQAHAATATFVTANYFSVLGVPVRGSGLSPVESADGETQIVGIISHGIWEQLFARRPDAIGATMMVEGVPIIIAGIAPPRFAGLNVFSDFKVWLPVSSRRVLVPGVRPDDELFGAAARLQPGVSHRAATAAVQVVAARAMASLQRPVDRVAIREPSTDVVPMLATNGDPQFGSDFRMLTVVFAGLGLLVLLVTCTNVSALQTGLAMMRRREIAIRLSMGAARTRIIRQLLTETMLLATIAGAAALGIVWVIQRVVMSRLPDMPIELVVTGPATLFTVGVGLAAGVIFGLSPALHATRMTVGSALKDSTGSIASPRVRLQRVLVVAQIAFTQPLIVGLAVMMLVLSSEFQRLGLYESGERVVSLRLRPTATTPVSPDDSASLLQRQRMELLQLRDRLTSTPGIVGAVEDLRFSLTLTGYSVHPDDRVAGGLQEALRISAPMVGPGYFPVMGIPLVLGREFTAHDISVPPERAQAEIPVIIGSVLARTLWPGANPIGRRLQPAADSPRPGHTLSVIGVVDQPADESRDATDGHRVYVPPDSARSGSSLVLLIRTAGDARPLLATIRTVVNEASPRLAIAGARTMADLQAETRHGFTVITSVLGGFGLVALLLSAIGLYAVVAFSVGQRTSEIAVRMAVGARARQIVGRFIGDGLRLGALGLLVGLPLSLIGVRMLVTADVLPKVSLVPVAAGAALGVIAVAIGGTWIPARRAAGIDPATVLRRD
jgi:predicted permease